MPKSPRGRYENHHKSNRDSLEKFIAGLPGDAEFNLSNWLQTLGISQLRRIEEDAQYYYQDEAEPNADWKTRDSPAVDLAHITLTAYLAEKGFAVNTEETSDRLDSLMIGLAVAACIERLKRRGWVMLTGQISVVMQDPRPYRVTQRGLEEGVWSDDPLTLWLLGTSIEKQ